MQCRRDHGQRQDQEQFRKKAAEEVIDQIGAECFSKDFLAMQPEQALERDEQDHEKHEPDTQAEHIELDRSQTLLEVQVHSQCRPKGDRQNRTKSGGPGSC